MSWGTGRRMKILFDSHALVWFLAGDTRFSRKARAAAERADATLCVSAATAWEIATKVRMGRWPEAASLMETFVETLATYSFEPLAITVEHARYAAAMTVDHRDPFDRMLAAQAQLESMPLVTADPAFVAFGVRTLW